MVGGNRVEVWCDARGWTAWCVEANGAGFGEPMSSNCALFIEVVACVQVHVVEIS